MKRITCFISSLTSGGAEHQLTILSGFLAEQGYDVTLTTFGGKEDHYLVNTLVKRHRIHHNGHNFSKILAIFWYFLSVKTDCIISFGARENFFCLIPLLFRRKIKVLAGERCATYKKLPWYKIVNYRWLYRRADFIVPNSYTQKNDISNTWPRYARKVRVVTNYTDIQEYRKFPLPNNNPLKIGVFCRYTEQKNYRRFALVVKCLKDDNIIPFKVYWYGNKHLNGKLTKEYLEFEKLVNDYKIGDYLILNDHTTNVSELLKEFDALCLPSLFEGFSNSISEYICCARPVLTSDVADNSVMVQDGKNGFLFNPESIDSMVTAFRKYFNLTESERKKMGEESRLLAENLFGKEKFLDSYIEMIEF